MRDLPGPALHPPLHEVCCTGQGPQGESAGCELLFSGASGWWAIVTPQSPHPAQGSGSSLG